MVTSKPTKGLCVEDWKEAVIHECIMCEIGWYEDDPIRTIKSLIQWNVDIAL